MRTWHVLTGEYPPDSGGISDYSRALVAGLTAAGAEVHVWCPPIPPRSGLASRGSVSVHRAQGIREPGALAALGRRLDAYARPRTLLLQYAPQAFGMRGMNVVLPLWLLGRRMRGDDVHVMFHEPFVEFTVRSIRRNVLALATRVMAVVLLRASRVVFVSTPAWEVLLRRWTLGSAIRFTWLPVPSTVPVVLDAVAIRAVRERVTGNGVFRRVVGHFGTYGTMLTGTLSAVLLRILRDEPDTAVLLMGRGSAEFREALLRATPDSGSRVVATGAAERRDLSMHLQACDVLVQPYPDGATTRRTTLMCAMAHGLPTVTTIGRFTEPLREAAGIPMAAAGDVEAIVGRVRSLLHDDRARREAGRRGQSLYDARFSLKHLVLALETAVNG